MSETGDMWRDFKANSQQRRANNRANADKLLRYEGIPFIVYNNGAHFVVSTENLGLIDFWPGTGKWIPRKTSSKQRGIHNLIMYIKGGLIVNEAQGVDYNAVPLPEEPNDYS